MRRLHCLMLACILAVILVLPASAEPGEGEAVEQLPPVVYVIDPDTLAPGLLGEQEMPSDEPVEEEPVVEEPVPEEPVMPLADIQDGYGVGTSNIQIFGPVASKLPYGVHYVYWREGQYVYKFAYSDSLVYQNGRFTATDAAVITYTTASGYQNQTTWRVGTDADFVLDSGNYLVWSDLGMYPTLYERGGEDYARLSCIMLASFGIFALFSRLAASIRRR